jgi:hypothetical protein
MQIFSRHELDALPWPDPSSSARRLLEALVREGPRPFLTNVEADVRAVVAGGAAMPLVLVDGSPPRSNAYVCSPTTHYVDYARREVELELAGEPLLRRALPPLIGAIRPLLRWSEVERAVYVNNWLLSTNLYPPLDAAALLALRDGLLAAFPAHTIVFRSLNPGLNGPAILALEQLGFERVFSRQVYLLDPRDGAFRRRNNYGNDRRLARRSPYRRLDAAQLAPRDAGRLAVLYADLYVGKYSEHNPQLTPYYVARALRDQWLDITALAANGTIDGVLGTIEQHGVITAPLVGYDRSRGEAAGLYRLLMLELLERAAARGRVLHLSSGAASFKRLRGAEPQLEYSLVYHRHLPPRRRLPWRLLAWLSRRAIIPLMERYGL